MVYCIYIKLFLIDCQHNRNDMATPKLTVNPITQLRALLHNHIHRYIL